jgi:hypothetical protein
VSQPNTQPSGSTAGFRCLNCGESDVRASASGSRSDK